MAKVNYYKIKAEQRRKKRNRKKFKRNLPVIRTPLFSDSAEINKFSEQPIIINKTYTGFYFDFTPEEPIKKQRQRKRHKK